MLKKFIGDKVFYRMVLAIALPIMLQTGITNFVNMLDNVMVGALGTPEMSGATIANQLFFIFNLTIFGAVSGAGIFGTQFFGKGDWDGVRHSLRVKLMLSLVLSVGAILLFWSFQDTLIGLYIAQDADPAQAAYTIQCAKEYLTVMLIGLIPFALTQCFSGTLRECGQTLLPMKAGITAVLVNLIFNYLLIFGKLGFPALGIKGAAIATVLSRFVELGIVVVWILRHREEYPFIKNLLRSLYVPAALVKGILMKGLPLMVNEALWATGIALMNQCYSVRGIDVVGAVSISQTFFQLFAVCFQAVGTAIGIIIGQMLGANESKEDVMDHTRKMVAFTVFTAIAVGTLYLIAAPFIPLLYNTTPAVRSIATGLMSISACFMPFMGFAHAAYFTIRSGGNVVITFLMDCCYTMFVCVPVALLLSRLTSLPILPLYACCQSLEVLKCVIGGYMLKKGAWIKNIVSDM